ncbi:MAG: trigger factor [Xanthomonadaceae bacterium]|nr:trigger factor [Xanthomonadaceae bacterium]
MNLEVKIEKPSNISRKMIITIPAEQVSKIYAVKLREAQSNANLKGFRKGHVPLDLVKKYYGSDIRSSVFNTLIDDSVFQVMRENKLRSIGRPMVESIDTENNQGLEESKEFKFTATVEVLPEVEPKEYKGLSIKRDKVEIKDEEIETVLTGLREQLAQLNPTEDGYKAVTGDFVEFDYEGFLQTEEGPKPLKNLKGHRQAFLGKGELLPEFEKNFLGVMSNSENTFKITYEKDYPEKDLAGNTVEFSVKVKEVKQKVLPEISDEFAKQAGYEDVSDVKTKAREFLLKNKTDEVNRKLRNDMLALLIEKNPVDVPQTLVESQSKEVALEFTDSLQRQGFNQAMITDALKSQKESIDQKALSQVKAGLILHAISKKESIAVKDADVEFEMKRIAESMNKPETEIRQFFDRNPERKDNLRYRLLEDETLSWVVSQAKIKEV